jgi:antitoxin (DNA-binding transcriptional repressor) of toxin-antitoxin stability system
MKTLNVSDFREQCLQLLDGLPADGILVTKRGRPLAKIMPVPSSCSELIGIMKGLASNTQDDFFSTGVAVGDREIASARSLGLWTRPSDLRRRFGPGACLAHHTSRVPEPRALDFKSDSADEIIAATSLTHDIPLLTRDSRIRKSKVVKLA